MVYDILVYLHTNFSIVLIGLICLIALLCFVLTWRRFRAETISQRAGKKEPESPAMEGALKQLLKEVQTSPQAAQPVSLEALTEKDRQRLEREVQKKLEAAGDPAAAEGAEVLQQLKRSEAELAQLQLKLKELKAGQEASTETERDAGEVEALQTRVQELEARLKEYEIIEDDIADLSTYKEENTRLRRQIEDLTGDAPLEKSGEQEVTPRKVAPSEKAADSRSCQARPGQ